MDAGEKGAGNRKMGLRIDRTTPHVSKVGLATGEGPAVSCGFVSSDSQQSALHLILFTHTHTHTHSPSTHSHEGRLV